MPLQQTLVPQQGAKAGLEGGGDGARESGQAGIEPAQFFKGVRVPLAPMPNAWVLTLNDIARPLPRCFTF